MRKKIARPIFAFVLLALLAPMISYPLFLRA